MSTPESSDLELIALSHGSNVDILADDYREMRSLLDTRLGGMALEAVSESEAAVVNRAFLEDFVGILPHIGDGSSFHVNSQTDVRWLQNSVLYWGEYEKPAYYILGSSTKGRKTDLLLHKASTEPGAKFSAKQEEAVPVVIATMGTKSYRNMRGLAAAKLHKPLSPQEMNSTYDHQSKKFIVKNSYRPGDNIMLATTYMTRKNPGDMFVRALSPNLWKIPAIAIKANLSAAVYGHTLAELNVANQISYLALAFGKEEELGKVIKKYVNGEEDEQLKLFN